MLSMVICLCLPWSSLFVCVIYTFQFLYAWWKSSLIHHSIRSPTFFVLLSLSLSCVFIAIQKCNLAYSTSWHSNVETVFFYRSTLYTVFLTLDALKKGLKVSYRASTAESCSKAMVIMYYEKMIDNIKGS